MRVYARKARLVLSSTFVEFMFFFLSLCYWVNLCFYYQLKSLPPNSLSKLLIQRKSLFKKISDLKNLAIQEFTHFRFVILVVILSTVKINFSRYLVLLSWLFRIIPFSHLFSHDFRYYDFPCSDCSDYSD